MLALMLSILPWTSYVTHPMALAVAVAALAGFAATVVIWPSSNALPNTGVSRAAAINSSDGSSVVPVILPFQAVRERLAESPTARMASAAAARSEKRRALRRKGVPVPLLVDHADKPGDVELAWVTDRSTGGLRLIFNRPLPDGDHFSVRAENAPADLPWVGVRV